MGDTWMTLWEHLEPVSQSPLDGGEAVDMVMHLSTGMGGFEGELPALGVWRNVIYAADYLGSRRVDVSSLLGVYERVYERIQVVELYPAHGDAHPGNMLPSATGWRWTDFEDASLMPPYWDLASFVANHLLFEGRLHATVQAALAHVPIASRGMFQLALEARVVMAPMTNLALALEGHGDRAFA